MPSFASIQSANKSLELSTLTAVFAGATSGIGLGAIGALLHHTVSPTVIIIGRSETKFAATLSRLQALHPAATITFIEAQVSLLTEVSRVCDSLISKHESIDILWLSQGGLGRKHHSLTPEGLNADFAVNYYSRLLFTRLLLPLLNRSADPRVISVLSAGQEGEVIMDDMGIKNPANHSVFPAMKQNVTMLSLALNHLARDNRGVSFMHTNPGMVSTAVHDK